MNFLWASHRPLIATIEWWERRIQNSTCTYLSVPQLTTPLKYQKLSDFFRQTKGPPLSPLQPLMPLPNRSSAHNMLSVILSPGLPIAVLSFWLQSVFVFVCNIACWSMKAVFPGIVGLPHPGKKWNVDSCIKNPSQ